MGQPHCLRYLDKEFDRIDTECPRYDKQFNHIDPALASLIFRNKTLRLTEPCGQFLPRDVRPSTGSGQTRAHDLVVLGIPDAERPESQNGSLAESSNPSTPIVSH